MTSSDLAGFIGKNRLLRRLVYAAVHVTTLREWYLTKALRQVLMGRRAFRFLDAGCGMGQHAVRIAGKYPDARVTAVDADEKQIDDCRDFAAQSGLHNLDFRAVRLDDAGFDDTFDVILCSSVLEHIEADDDVLSTFYRTMAPGGSLVVYVPVSEKRVLRSLEKKINKMTRQANAELPHDHVRYYKPDELRGKIERAGFCIVNSRNTYGRFGRWSYDLVTTVQYSRYAKLIFPFYLLFVHPWVMMLMWLDTQVNIKEGNGLLIIAEKK